MKTLGSASLKTAAACAVCVVAISASAVAQDFSWQKAIAPGHVVEIKGVNGDVIATGTSGSAVVVTAKKSARRSNPEDVKIEVVEHDGDVTICAVYPTPRTSMRKNVCAPGNKGSMSTRNNDTNVRFEVRLPRGVRFEGRTVNGDVEATGLMANASVATVNGGIKVSSSGVVTATTVNGGINVRMGTAPSESLDFTTVNGSIVVEMPAGLNADVEASTVNGSMSSDWPLTVQGKWGPRKMHGKIGTGGSSLSLSTVNGDIDLKKAN